MNSELWERDSKSATLPLTLDEVLLEVGASRAKKVLFWGERMSGISSYLAGWMAGGGIDVIVLDGANGFDPYTVSSFARKTLISPERLLKKIRIARAFTCYQMATLVERLALLLHREGNALPGSFPSPFRSLPAGRKGRKGAVGILLGPITTFLDEDVPEREIGPLFERTLQKMEGMAEEGIPLLLFQSCAFSQNHSGKEMSKRSSCGAEGFMGAKRAHLMRRLFQFSNLTWKVLLEEEGPKLVLEKGPIENIREKCKLQNEKWKIPIQGPSS